MTSILSVFSKDNIQESKSNWDNNILNLANLSRRNRKNNKIQKKITKILSEISWEDNKDDLLRSFIWRIYEIIIFEQKIKINKYIYWIIQLKWMIV